MPGSHRGEQLYGTFCMTCHGADGRGQGPASPFTRLPPADFTQAAFRQAASAGELPTDHDIAEVIRNGAHGDGVMPAFPFLGTQDLRALVEKIKTFSPRWGARHSQAPLILREPVPGRTAARPVSTHERSAGSASSVASYWQTPLAAGTSKIAASTCASCHPLQFADWSRSRHALAMGPGLAAQLQDGESGSGCVRCHAPLAEQATDPFLLADGVSCAVCHLRAGQTFGPPATATTLLPLVASSTAPHGKVQTRPIFEQPDFCAGCHHFADGTAPIVGGRTLQNTYEEWQNSRAAREGRTCQSCHMPDRRHFFRGIHDPETVRRAVRWHFETNPRGIGTKARMTLTNVGAGHYLPTYVVPEIWMRIDVKDAAGATLASVEHRIARKVTLRAGEWTQESDTRLPPDATATLEYTGPIPPGAALIVGRVVVLPDLWQADKFRARLAAAPSQKVHRYYAAALEEAESSGYTLFERSHRFEQ